MPHRKDFLVIDESRFTYSHPYPLCCSRLESKEIKSSRHCRNRYTRRPVELIIPSVVFLSYFYAKRR